MLRSHNVVSCRIRYDLPPWDCNTSEIFARLRTQKRTEPCNFFVALHDAAKLKTAYVFALPVCYGEPKGLDSDDKENVQCMPAHNIKFIG